MNKLLLLIIALGAILLRAMTSLQLYSGYAKPPMYGDFEAQRHWQEITINLPISDWYQNTTDNDLMYWGLDYPPLTAYHSWMLGWVARSLNQSYIELHKSRGITNDSHKLFMRSTVLLADIFLYIPAMICACKAIFNAICQHQKGQKDIGRQSMEALYLIVGLYYPGQILIDNGHFQYNNVSLGLFILAVWAIMRDRNLLATVFFVLALNYKQMELYHALPFFFYLLAKAVNSSRDSHGMRLAKAMRTLVVLGTLVIFSFVVIWLPWLNSLTQVAQVVHRIFPVARGVFEDKVANAWCFINVIYKLK